ncbi:hypothetical protein BJF83_17195 [Nocardiopsis sp. CNR-923]|uniref:hypothetical protein n=1 Tax=Nocardiopsis sp. CNR-923 TaxID=1904965 RepID=UPI00096652D3|nr:hypothetical protein [Nocardiopsis sp. CNR-923]OLT27827.1 hypothetical protein BJF83_17195 [Nocardiopsis sp. CNR-923]
MLRRLAEHWADCETSGVLDPLATPPPITEQDVAATEERLSRPDRVDETAIRGLTDAAAFGGDLLTPHVRRLDRAEEPSYGAAQARGAGLGALRDAPTTLDDALRRTAESGPPRTPRRITVAEARQPLGRASGPRNA